MTSVRILHTHETGYGWFFSSPDLPGLTGSDKTYAAAKLRAEDASRFHIECDAEEHDRPVPDLAAIEFQHFVNADAAAAVPAAA